MLFKMNIRPVKLYASSDPPKMIRPMSQTSRTSGCFMQNFQRMYEVYWTDAATEIVTITPGPIPRTEKDLIKAFKKRKNSRCAEETDQGNDRMARQIYSDISNAVVCTKKYEFQASAAQDIDTDFLPAACTILDSMTIFFSNLGRDAMHTGRRAVVESLLRVLGLYVFRAHVGRVGGGGGEEALNQRLFDASDGAREISARFVNIRAVQHQIRQR